MFRKGQAAMEFLMTYGWAILVVLIAIGALAYFGVLNPSRFLPNSCTLFPGMACKDFYVKDSAGGDWVAIFLSNGIGDAITILPGAALDQGSCTTVRLQGGSKTNPVPSPTGVPLCASACGAGIISSTIPDGNQTALLNFSGCSGISKGDRFRAAVTLPYSLGSGGLAHTRTGQLVAQAE